MASSSEIVKEFLSRSDVSGKNVGLYSTKGVSEPLRAPSIRLCAI